MKHGGQCWTIVKKYEDEDGLRWVKEIYNGPCDPPHYYRDGETRYRRVLKSKLNIPRGGYVAVQSNR